MGPAGAAISVLLSTITILAGAIVVLFKQNNGHNKARLAEREVLIKVIEANNTALNKSAEATEERNRVTQELANAIDKQASAFTIVNERVGLYHEDNKEKLKDLSAVVGSTAEALRVNTGMLTEVRNGNLALQTTLQRRRT